MQCEDIRAQLSLIRPDSRDAEQPEFAAARAHLSHCADCQAYWELQQQSDRELGRAIRNVSIPADFKSRLSAQLAAALAAPGPTATSLEPAATETAQPISDTQPRPKTRPGDQTWTRRRAATVASAAMLLLAVGSWFFLNTPRQVELSVDDLVALSQAQDTMPAHFSSSVLTELPFEEIQTPPNLAGITPLSVRYQGQEIGMLVPYQTGRNKALSVVLMVINLDPRRVVVSNLRTVGSSFVSARVEYPPPQRYATRIWRVGNQLYVCYVKSHDVHDLDRLRIQNVVS